VERGAVEISVKEGVEAATGHERQPAGERQALSNKATDNGSLDEHRTLCGRIGGFWRCRLTPVITLAGLDALPSSLSPLSSI